MVTRQENSVQHATTVALQCHFDRDPNAPRFEAFPPYANQQGDDMRRYCGDLVARLGGSRIIVLEFKELNCQTRVLKDFRPDQHASCLAFERQGVPIAYAYNTIEPLPYHGEVLDRDWPATTLRGVNRALPSLLLNERPNIPGHQTLLDWLTEITETGADAPEPSAALGRIHGMFQRASSLRNGALVLIHNVSEDTLNALTPAELDTLVKVLTKKAKIDPQGQETLQAILGGEASVFAAFAAAPLPPPALGRRRNGPR